MKPSWEKIFSPFVGERKLNIGCGFNPEKGWVNLDMNPASPAEVIADMRKGLPFQDGTFDTVLASHVLEHFDPPVLIDLIYDIARVLKLGGHLIAAVPYGTHPSAWENPHHRQRFTEITWAYFDRRLYEQDGTSGTGAGQGHQYALWSQQYGSLARDTDGQTSEMQVVLRKEGM